MLSRLVFTFKVMLDAKATPRTLPVARHLALPANEAPGDNQIGISICLIPDESPLQKGKEWGFRDDLRHFCFTCHGLGARTIGVTSPPSPGPSRRRMGSWAVICDGGGEAVQRRPVISWIR